MWCYEFKLQGIPGIIDFVNSPFLSNCSMTREHTKEIVEMLSTWQYINEFN